MLRWMMLTFQLHNITFTDRECFLWIFKLFEMLLNNSYRHSAAFLCSEGYLRARRLPGRKLLSPFGIYQRLRNKNEIVRVILRLKHTKSPYTFKTHLSELVLNSFQLFNSSCYHKLRFVSRSDRSALRKAVFHRSVAMLPRLPPHWTRAPECQTADKNGGACGAHITISFPEPAERDCAC